MHWIKSKIILLLVLVLYSYNLTANNTLMNRIWEVRTVTVIWENYQEFRQYFASHDHIPGAKQITILNFQQDQIIAQVVDSLGNIRISNIDEKNNPYLQYRILFTDSKFYAWLPEEKKYFYTPYQVSGNLLHIIHPGETVDILGTYRVNRDTLTIEEKDKPSKRISNKYRTIYRYHAVDSLDARLELKKVKKFQHQKGFDLSGPGPFPD